MTRDHTPSTGQSDSQQPARILIVDDDTVVADSMAELIAGSGYVAASVYSAADALDELNRAASPQDGLPEPYAVIITDMSMPETDGMALIRAVMKRHPAVTPIAITGYGTIEAAVKAVRAGALDYLTKPVVDRELLMAVEKAVQQHALRAENTSLKRRLGRRDGLDDIIGDDPRMQQTYETIEAVAASKTTVLMCGESGTGKSLIARSIHQRSPRSKKPFIDIACGSIPETLLESELFGHVKGAFTGAHADKPGKFLAAHTGTIFLDEINSASPAMQLKLLRVLQEKVIEPVGSNETIEVDVRVILASNHPLEDLVARGTFRQDLYYRINVVSITLPPLRDRAGDIPNLAAHFLQHYATEAGRQITGITGEAMEAMCRYRYPGNVRELENIVERAVVLSRAAQIGIDDLPPHVRAGEAGPLAHAGMDANAGPWQIEDLAALPLREAMEVPEKQIILAALEAHAWNRQKTAEQLDINRTTLYKKIKQYGLEQFDRAG